MELPDDVLMYLKEFTRPISRPDWRKGCACNKIISNQNNTFNDFIGHAFYIKVDMDTIGSYGYDENSDIHRWDDDMPDVYY
jgi:hypothetical protein